MRKLQVFCYLPLPFIIFMQNLTPLVYPRPFVETVTPMYVGDKAHDFATLREIVINDRKIVEQRFFKNINTLADLIEGDLAFVLLSFSFNENALVFSDKQIGFYVESCLNAPLSRRLALLATELLWTSPDDEEVLLPLDRFIFNLSEQLIFLRDGWVTEGNGVMYVDISNRKVYLRTGAKGDGGEDELDLMVGQD